MLYCSIAGFNQSQALFIQSRYLQLMLMLLYDSLNLIVSVVKLWIVLAP